MAERRTTNASARAGGGAGAPGSTGAFKTSDPLGAPGSTGAGQTNRDPTSIPGVGPVYQETEFDYTGGQQQQHRHPTSGTGQHHELQDPLSGLGQQQQQHRHPTSGVGHVSTGQQHELHDPLSGLGQQHQQHHHPTAGAGQHYELHDPLSGLGQQHQQHHQPTSGAVHVGTGQHQELHDHQQHRQPTSSAGHVGTGQHDPLSGLGQQHQPHLHRVGQVGHQQELRDPTTGVGFGGTGEYEQSQVEQGPAGFTRVTTAAAPVPGGGVAYGREMEKVEEVGASGKGKEEKKGVAEKAKEVKDKIIGAACGHHEP